jgi:hypothetical protein
MNRIGGIMAAKLINGNGVGTTKLGINGTFAPLEQKSNNKKIRFELGSNQRPNKQKVIIYAGY